MNPLNLFDDFDLDIVKIANAKGGTRTCDNPDDGSSGVPGTITCPFNTCTFTETDPDPTVLTECISVCDSCSDTPACQSLEGRC